PSSPPSSPFPYTTLFRSYVLFPTDPTLEAYETIFASPLVFRSLGVSVFVTVVGTLLALFVTICMAYALSRPVLGGKFMLMAIILDRKSTRLNSSHVSISY